MMVAAAVIASPPPTSTLQVRFATFTGTLHVTVGGAMEMIVVTIEIMEIKVLILLPMLSILIGTMTLAPPTTSPAS
jgi:hypothetical protein